MIISRLLEHEMHMARSVAMAFQSLQELANRSIVRDWIGHGNDCLEPEDAFLVTVHYCSLIRTFTAGVLDVVVAFAIGLPDVDLDFVDRLALGVLDRA